MTPKICTAMLILVISLIFTGCSKDDDSNPVNSNNEQSYYPLAVGNSWNYRKNDNSGYQQTVTVNSTIKINETNIYLFDGDDDYLFGYGGLNIGLFNYENALWGCNAGDNNIIISNNPTVGEKHNLNIWEGAKVEIISLSETIAVPAGTYECIRINFYT